MKVHHLDCGTLCPLGGKALLRDASSLVCHCLLVELPNSLMLVDTGLGTRDIADARRLGAIFRGLVRPRLDLEESAIHRVRELGFEPEDVRDIVLTHLDLDHAGGMSDFPWARVHLFADEWQSAQAPQLRERSRYRAVHWEHGPERCEYVPDGEPFFGLARARELDGLPPEVQLISLPGHSRGHAGVALETNDGLLMHCGDAYFHHAEVDASSERPRAPAALGMFQNVTAHDNAMRKATQAQLRAAITQAGGTLRTTCAHDGFELARERLRASRQPS